VSGPGQELDELVPQRETSPYLRQGRAGVGDCPVAHAGTSRNLAVTVSFRAFSEQTGADPRQSPPQPKKRQFGAGRAVSLMVLPGLNGPAHVRVHEIPAGLLVTLPEPTTPTATRANDLNLVRAEA
jgi:hypothetical protein